MKTLQNHTLVYDTDCPLCALYTKGFISCQMLDENGRKPYVELDPVQDSCVDMERAKDEIALVDIENNTVVYGIDSLLKVVGNRFPIIEKIGKNSVVNYVLRKIYSFVSYNRKVIAPSKHKVLECVPTFNFKYRCIYIFFTVLITSFSLFKFSELIPEVASANFSRELLIATFQMCFQAIFILDQPKKKVMNYYGNLMTVSVIGALLLLPILLVNTFVLVPFSINITLFIAVVLFMFFEHKRRVQILELPSYLSFTWVFYRIIVLVTLLQ